MPRSGRIALRAVVLVLATCGVAGPAAAGTPTLPPQGVYDGCAPARSADGCASRLRRIGQAGFRVVVNGGVFEQTSEERLVAYAQTAAAAGVQVIWPLHAFGSGGGPGADDLLGAHPLLAARCGCRDNQGLLAYLVGILRRQPNTWGYYLYDEPKRDQHDQLAAWVAQVKALDPDHERMIMGCGICYGGDPTGANIAFLADLDVALGTDAYPVREGGPDPRAAYSGVAQNAGSLARVARPGQRRVVALQAWRWGDSDIDVKLAGLDPRRTRFPSREEIQAQRDAAVTAGRPDLILWFNLNQVIGWEPGQRPPYWAEPPDAAQRWDNLISGAFAPLPNDRPVARLRLRTRGRVEVGRRVVADARASRDPDGRIVRYRWTLDGRPLACRMRSCAFRARRSGLRRLTLTVVDDRDAVTVTHRNLRVRPEKPRRGRTVRRFSTRKVRK